MTTRDATRCEPIELILSGEIGYYRDAPHRDLIPRLVAIAPSLAVEDKGLVLQECHGDRLLSWIVQGMHRAAMRRVALQKNPILADQRFLDQIFHAFLSLQRTRQRIETGEYYCSNDAWLIYQDLYEIAATYLALTGYAQARPALMETMWVMARQPGYVGGVIGRRAFGFNLLAPEDWPAQEPGLVYPDMLIVADVTADRVLLRGVAEPRRETHAQAMDDDRAGIVRLPVTATASEMIETARLDSAPSLIVLATTDHLPGTARCGEDRIGGSNSTNSTSARSEYAPFASRRWPLVRVLDLAQARKILVDEFPYAGDIVDAVLRDLAGRPHVHLRPLLIVGPPGSGKTRLARRLAEVLGLGWQIISCGGVSDSSLNGTSRQWGTGRASVPLQLLKRLGAASAVIVLDEIEKAASGTQNGSMLDGLLTLTADAAHFFDPYVEHPVDLSGISWIATANELTGLRKDHGALVDRFRIFSMPSPRRQDLPVLVRRIMAEIRAERGLDERWLPDLDGDEEALIQQHFDGGSVRRVRRLCETLVAGREALATRM